MRKSVFYIVLSVLILSIISCLNNGNNMIDSSSDKYNEVELSKCLNGKFTDYLTQKRFNDIKTLEDHIKYCATLKEDFIYKPYDKPVNKRIKYVTYLETGKHWEESVVPIYGELTKISSCYTGEYYWEKKDYLYGINKKEDGMLILSTFEIEIRKYVVPKDTIYHCYKKIVYEFDTCSYSLFDPTINLSTKYIKVD